MTKTLGQIQQENRKFILEAIHGCSYEEALQKEEGHNCLYIYSTPYGNLKLVGDVKYYGYNRKKHHPDAFVKEIIGKPITLSRVLLAFKNKEVKSIYKDEIIFDIESSKFCGLKLEEEYYNPHYSLYGAGNWNLEIEELEEQSEETQMVINKLLTEYLIDNIKQ